MITDIDKEGKHQWEKCKKHESAFRLDLFNQAVQCNNKLQKCHLKDENLLFTMDKSSHMVVESLMGDFPVQITVCTRIAKKKC